MFSSTTAFSVAVISAALVSQASADPCAVVFPTDADTCLCEQSLGANFPDLATCEAYIDVTYALIVEGDNYGWEILTASTAGIDYELSMVHLTSDGDGTALTPSLGPILLLHGLFYDDGSPSKGWREWFLSTPNDDTRQAIPIRLANLGYDVYIGSLRGFPYSTAYNNGAISDADYWDFTNSANSLDDIPTLINRIVQDRSDNNAACLKVNVVAHAFSAASALETASTYAYTAEENIASLSLLAPCMVPRLSGIFGDSFSLPPEEPVEPLRMLEGIDIAADGTERIGRSLRRRGRGQVLKARIAGADYTLQDQTPSAYIDLIDGETELRRLGSGSKIKKTKDSKKTKSHSHSSEKCWSNWNRGAYNDAIGEVRMELGYRSDEYRAFYRLFKDWRKEFGNEWKCDENWIEGITEALCAVEPCSQLCQPAEQAVWSNLFKLMSDNDINTFYGPNWSEIDGDLDTICRLLGDDPTDICSWLSGSAVGLDQGFQECQTGPISIKQMDHLVQQAFNGAWTAYSDTFGTDGWCAEPTLNTLNDFNVPVYAQYISQEDPLCVQEANREILSQVTSQVNWTTWTDGRGHSLPNFYDKTLFYTLVGQLRPAEVCGASVVVDQAWLFEEPL